MTRFNPFLPFIVLLGLGLVQCGSGAKITYSGTEFTEAAANDGSIGDTITATLEGATFAAAEGDLTEDTDFTLSGTALPAGLTVKVTLTSDTEAEISLEGAATDHEAADSVEGVVLTFEGAAFEGGGANVDDFTFSIAFDDALPDEDGDGIPDADDPTPHGSTANMLNSTFSGGHAEVVAITAVDSTGAEDLDLVYNDDLTEGCDSSWYPQGTLCDEAPTADSQTVSTRSDEDSGSTWESLDDDDGVTTGILVVDACKDTSCTLIDFNEARVFQMYSDGKTTQVRLAIHAETGATPPAWDDAGWDTITDFEDIGAGTDQDDDGLVVLDPTVLSVGPQLTRYVRIEARNIGTHGDEDYTELRAVKLFSNALP